MKSTVVLSPKSIIVRDAALDAGVNFFDGAIPALRPAATCGNDESLAERMSVPGGARSGLESYAGALNEGRIGSLKERIDAHGAGEPLGWSFGGRLRAGSLDFHFSEFLWVSPRRKQVAAWLHCSQTDSLPSVGAFLWDKIPTLNFAKNAKSRMGHQPLRREFPLHSMAKGFILLSEPGLGQPQRRGLRGSMRMLSR